MRESGVGEKKIRGRWVGVVFAWQFYSRIRQMKSKQGQHHASRAWLDLSPHHYLRLMGSSIMLFPFKLGWKEQKLNKQTSKIKRVILSAEVRPFHHQGDIFRAKLELGCLTLQSHPASRLWVLSTRPVYSSEAHTTPSSLAHTFKKHYTFKPR